MSALCWNEDYEGSGGGRDGPIDGTSSQQTAGSIEISRQLGQPRSTSISVDSARLAPHHFRGATRPGGRNKGTAKRLRRTCNLAPRTELRFVAAGQAVR